MTLPNAETLQSFADPNSPIAQITRTKKRVEAIGRQFAKLSPTVQASEDTAAREMADLAYANWLTAKGLTQAADALFHRRAVDMLLSGNKVEIEIAQASMKDVRALSILQSCVKNSTSALGADEPEVVLGGKDRFGCLAPDPDSWFKPNLAAPSDQPAPCNLPSMTIVMAVDFSGRYTQVQELLRLAEATLVEAERELGETRARLCHSEDGTCQLF
ncbi:MAG: hypothetical protein IPP57_17795 [Candidatus Obscuribacter sp.]|jgi:hypothetical protein|nr:hypothetical protein [Candidatus Obscuribacter sp.]MDQ5967877.1 hypothetical protein [Cyanobacteriota bacterium erpe_2018_sw_39hr_WHONDRS-SW48-000098_B_bin.30]MBK9204904.1 hypothetical protein [Candidatus Obscuribacter sp.]MBK9620610.1 hypothetical protein [Candidatus Obscuribacter sp.]MBK9772639.1 hypothetical protein [Candidatus Obscuribacter sp.]